MPHSTPLYGISRLQRRSQQRPDSFCREIATFIHKRCLPGFDPELAYGLRLSAWPDRVEYAKTLPGFANGYFHFLGPITFCGTDGLLPETTTCHPAILRRKIDSIAIHANFQIRSHHKGPREPIGARPYRLLKPLANQRVENKMLRKFNKFVNLLYCFSCQLRRKTATIAARQKMAQDRVRDLSTKACDDRSKLANSRPIRYALAKILSAFMLARFIQPVRKAAIESTIAPHVLLETKLH